MPIYEYACPRCRKIFSFLVRNVGTHRPPKCPKCAKGGMKRSLSAFSVSHSEESRMERMADPAFLSGLDENDPKSLARFMRKMGGELGEEMPEEFDEICDRLEAGENPESIEKSLEEGGGGGFTRDTSGTLYE